VIFFMSAALSATTAVLAAHGICPDRCEILQDGHTLVVRLTSDLVARVVTDRSGPRQGVAWFARENAVAAHLTQAGAPVIPLHSGLPAEVHLQDGYPMNFWEFVTQADGELGAAEVGRVLKECHAVLSDFQGELPHLAILHESLGLLPGLREGSAFDDATLELLAYHLESGIAALAGLPYQALHGDAHLGNFLLTTRGLLLTDWEDAFCGPVEWDIASMIWNAQLLEKDAAAVEGMLRGYTDAGGCYDEGVLRCCLTVRAAVMTAWYPILYPNMNEERRAKLQYRLDYLAGVRDSVR
jgi:hypothetical protein